jgi:predicted metal-binding membrane protein
VPDAAPVAGAVRPLTRPVLNAASMWVVGVGAVAWIGTIVWARTAEMDAMPGTMDMAVAAFVAMWSLMMAAMMLPSVAPLAGLYARTITERRAPRLTAFGAGYLLAWASTGAVAFWLADFFADVASGRSSTGKAVAATAFAVCGLYQLTPLKDRCLGHCRSPLTHVFRYASFRGATRDLRAGLHHGLFCLGCCWTLMVLLVAFGVMNLVAMVGLALVIGVEKHWRHGRRFARAVGIAALVLAVLVVLEPGLAPGLDPGGTEEHDMQMEMD